MGNAIDSRVVITVDGLAGCGKTSLAKGLARKLGYVHFHTGALYRTVGLLALEKKIDLEDEAAVVELLTSTQIRLIENSEASVEIMVGSRNFSEDKRLSLPTTSQAASVISKHQLVRSSLIALQREALPQRNLVAEGRDMGTVIFPDAKAKFFVETAPQVRIARRIKQLLEDNPDFSAEQVNLLKKDMEIEVLERDRRDVERVVAPTVPAENAIVIDNSSETLTNVVERMYAFVS